MTTGGPTVVVAGAGYEGKHRYYQRLAGLDARLVILDEPGHWSESLKNEIAGTAAGSAQSNVTVHFVLIKLPSGRRSTSSPAAVSDILQADGPEGHRSRAPATRLTHAYHPVLGAINNQR